MTEPVSPQEMFELFQKMVNPMAFPMQSLLTASLNVDELDKKITELKTVEHWLQANVAMLQMTVKTLEYQKAILESTSGGTKGGENAFADAAAWWSKTMQAMSNPPQQPPTEPVDGKSSKRKTK